MPGQDQYHFPRRALTQVVVLDRVTADTTVGNTVTETTIYTFSVAGNTISTNKRLRLTLQGRIQGTTGVAAVSATIRLKYGATTVATGTFVAENTDGTSNCVLPANTGLVLTALLSGDGATNAQVGNLSSACSLVGVGGIGGASLTALAPAGVFITTTTCRGTAAEDSTAAKTLLISLQWSAANATDTYTMDHAILELL